MLWFNLLGVFDKLPERLPLTPRADGEVGVGGVTVVSGAGPELVGVIFRSVERDPPRRDLGAERDGEVIGFVASVFTPPLLLFRGGVLIGVTGPRFC